MADVVPGPGQVLTISGSRRSLDGRPVELRDSPVGYLYLARSRMMHARDCWHEPAGGEKRSRDEVVAAWRAAPEQPADPRWCTTCLVVDDEGPASQPVRHKPDIDAVSQAAWLVIRHILGDRRSIVAPDLEIWTRAVAGRVLAAVTAEHDPGQGTAHERLRSMLRGAPPECVLLAAEAIYLRSLPLAAAATSPEKKREDVDTVLAWLGDARALPDGLAAGLGLNGVFNGGTPYARALWRQIRWIAQFATAVDALDEVGRDRLQADPWALRELLTGDLDSPASMRNAFAAMAYPGAFEFIVGDGAKRTIRDAFTQEIGGATGADAISVDRDLAAIRAALSRDASAYVDWYSQPWRTRWQRPVTGPVAPTRPNIASLASLPRATAELTDALHIDAAWLDGYIALLETRRQVVVYGPPGTGKTFVAREIARHVTDGDPDRLTIVQFHPSYSYEDFFEGLRPVTTAEGQIAFRVQPGPLRRIAERATESALPHVLIVDEINRANIAKVFGELYYLLEYRDERVALQYSPERPFQIPANLFLIGTMNTADRSIALVDAAIRRRFSFIEMHPSAEPVAGLLGRFIQDPDDPRPGLLAALNAEIGDADRDFHVGPSYLMRPEADSAMGLARVWRHDILPLLEEHYYGRLTREDVVGRFGLAAVRAGVKRQASAVVGRP